MKLFQNMSLLAIIILILFNLIQFESNKRRKVKDQAYAEAEAQAQAQAEVDAPVQVKLFKNNILFIASSFPWEKDYFYHMLSNASGKKIYVFSSNKISYVIAKNQINLFKPDVIIHFSDEWGGKNEYDELSKLTKLYLRQYSHKEYPIYDNKYIIPLGYQSGMFDKIPINLSLKPISERKYKWSFIGDFTKNVDRREMVDCLESVNPHYLGKANSLEMKNIYCDSIFVPNAKGNCTLDCFRLYEATSCGAIPLLVGPKDERQYLVENQNNPPWPQFDNWNDAKDQIENYDEKQIQILQNKNLIWWSSRLEFIIKKISE